MPRNHRVFRRPPLRSPKLCEKCGKDEAVVNLNTATCVDGDGSGPDLWICVQCLREGVNSPEAQALAEADDEIAEHLQEGGRLS
jgi:hypothetical protein